MKLSNDKNILYNLICFIEVITNILYFMNNNNVWTKYLGNNQYENVNNIENIKPKILFYKKADYEGYNTSFILNQIVSNSNQVNININNINKITLTLIII